LAPSFSRGILGGITVLWYLPDAISIAHASLAQILFCLTVTIALATSSEWKRGYTAGPKGSAPPDEDQLLQRIAIATTAMIYVQILIGATMRHTGAGLAIPDFPTLVRSSHSAALGLEDCHSFRASRRRGDSDRAHRRDDRHVFFHHARRAELRRPALLILVLLVVQVALGAITVLGNKPFIINSLHVVNGALVLVTSLVLTLRAHRSRFADAGSAEQDPAYDRTDAARTLSPDHARRAKAGEVGDAAKGYGRARA
jgi:cytochrome c oxidase assembly protein subunit 15